MFDSTVPPGTDVLDCHGVKIGTVDNVYLDDVVGKPAWLSVKTGLFGMNSSFVPLDDATFTGGVVRVPWDKNHVKDAPNVSSDGALGPDEEARLYAHYHRAYEPGVAAEGVADDAMTRSEEEVSVRTAGRERRVRLRKYIVTENVTKAVPVQREEVRIEREPVTDANMDEALSGPELTESEHEVVLHEEVPVVEKRVVPKERVRLDKDTHTAEETVNEEVRREQIEVEEQHDHDRFEDEGGNESPLY